jgi:hypothetical protein
VRPKIVVKMNEKQYLFYWIYSRRKNKHLDR